MEFSSMNLHRFQFWLELVLVARETKNNTKVIKVCVLTLLR